MKLFVLARLSILMCKNKKRTLMKVFIESQFGFSIAGESTTKLTNYMSDRHDFTVKSTLALSNLYLKRKSRLLLIRGTVNPKPYNYLKLNEIFQTM